MRTFCLLIVSIAALFFVTNAAEAAGKESAYDRVMRTKTLRCGYIVWGELLRKDPNTGKLSGPTYDFVTAIGREMGWNVEWTEETGWGNFHEGLNAGRYDLMCAFLWQSGFRAQAALLTKPVAFTPMYAFVRENDSRFDVSLSALDKPGVKIAVIEGDPTQDARKRKFPHAGELSLAANVDTGTAITTLAYGKADALLLSLPPIREYNAHAKVKLKLAANGDPVKMIAFVLAVGNGEDRLKYLVDTAIDIINVSGEGADIVYAYDTGDSPVLPPAPRAKSLQKKQPPQRKQ